MKKLLVTSLLVLTGLTSVAASTTNQPNYLGEQKSFVNRGIKKAIDYKNIFSYEFFNGETMEECPTWASVNTSTNGGATITDDSTGISFKVYTSTNTGFKYSDEKTGFSYGKSIKTGGSTSSSRYLSFTIPQGIKAKLKAELYSSSNVNVFLDSSAKSSASSTQTNYKSVNGQAVDFVSEELNPGTYYLNFSGTVYFGKIIAEVQGMHEVKFLDSDETPIKSVGVKDGETTEALKIDDKLGLKFKHWAKTPGGAAYNFQDPIKDDVTLYAVYEACEIHTVTFNLNYTGSEAIKQQVNDNSVATKPETPSRLGYKFDDWFYNNAKFNFQTLITEDITLFAKWSLDSLPVISGPDSLRFGYSQATDIEAILLQYSASDVEDEEVAIKLENDTYTLNANEIGTYEIVISATDSSGNKTVKTIPVEVYDNVAPVIEGPEFIYKSTSVALTTNDILKQIKATDVVDGECEVEIISDSYTGYANKVGDYALNLLAKDKAGNRRTFNLNVVVSDKIPNVWYVKEKTIKVQKNIQLTSQEVIDLMLQTGELNSGYSKIDVISNYAFKAEEEGVESLTNDPGIYSVTLKARYYSGEEKSITRAIEVYDSEEATQKRDNGFVKFWKGFYNVIIRNVSNFFIRIYNEVVKLFGHKEWQSSYLKKLIINE